MELPAEVPEPPEDLPEEARAEWDLVCPFLLDAGVLSRVDRSVLIGYVRAWAAYCELERQVRASGWTYTTENGEYRSAAARQLEVERAAFIRLGRELGITPSARSDLYRRQAEEERRRHDPLTRAGDARRGRKGGQSPGLRLPSAREGPVAVQYDANEGPAGRRREGAPTPRLPSARDGPNAMDEMALPDPSQGPPRKRERNEHSSTGGSTEHGEQRGE